MINLKTIDIKVADLLRRSFAFYIRKRSGFKENITTEVSQNNLWESLFEGGREEYLHPLSDKINIILYKDSILCKCIYFGFEQEELIFLDKYLKEGDSFVDIGANVGLYSLLASEKIGNNGKIIAFEPTPTVYERFVKNISLNKIKTITAQNVALSNQEGILNFYTSNTGYDAWNSFAKLPQLESSKEIKANMTTLDILLNLEYNDIKIDLIKLDVEGWEYFVLQGAKDLLSRKDSPAIMIEFNEVNAFAAGYYCGNVYDFLKSHNYEMYKFDITTNSFIKQQKKLHYSCENLIAIKDIEKASKRINLKY